VARTVVRGRTAGCGQKEKRKKVADTRPNHLFWANTTDDLFSHSSWPTRGTRQVRAGEVATCTRSIFNVNALLSLVSPGITHSSDLKHTAHRRRLLKEPLFSHLRFGGSRERPVVLRASREKRSCSSFDSVLCGLSVLTKRILWAPSTAQRDSEEKLATPAPQMPWATGFACRSRWSLAGA